MRYYNKKSFYLPKPPSHCFGKLNWNLDFTCWYDHELTMIVWTLNFFYIMIMTMIWHCFDHVLYFWTSPGKRLFQSLNMAMIWPWSGKRLFHFFKVQTWQSFGYQLTIVSLLSNSSHKWLWYNHEWTMAILGYFHDQFYHGHIFPDVMDRPWFDHVWPWYHGHHDLINHD